MYLSGFGLASKVVLVATLLAVTGFVFAAGKKLPLPIGVAEFPPFKFTSASGKVVGADTEIVEKVFRKMGYALDIRMQPWPRVQAGGESGEFAAIYSFTKTPEREKNYYFSEPINAVKDVFYKRKKDKIAWRSFDDLKNLRVGTSAGYRYAPEFQRAVTEKTFTAVFETADANPDLVNLRNLAAGHIDVAICEVSVCQHLIHSNESALHSLDFIPKTIGPVRTFHVGFSKRWPNSERLAEKFNVALANFFATGQHRAIYKKYGIIAEVR